MIDQMSIRRKTCETTSLLYEAALKTNLSEQNDRPNNVNPTAGVRMREQYGNSVFMPDTSKPGGGIWIASSKDEMLNSGLPQTDQVLKAEYPMRGEAKGTLDQRALENSGTGFGQGNRNVNGNGNGNVDTNRPEFMANNNNNNTDLSVFQGMQNAENVNPNINDVGIPIDPNGGGGGVQQGLAGQDVRFPFTMLCLLAASESLMSSCLWIQELGEVLTQRYWRDYH